MGTYEVRKTFCQRTQRLAISAYRADQLAAHGELLFDDARLVVGPKLLQDCEEAPSEVWFTAIRVATDLRLAELTVGYTTLNNVWGGSAQAILGSALQPLWDTKVGARLVLTNLHYRVKRDSLRTNMSPTAPLAVGAGGYTTLRLST